MSMQRTEQSSQDGRTLLWGDLHNHNAVGYARGSLARSIDVAREHLDFFAFTGHASWHDIPEMPGDRHMKWINGFDVHRRHWPKTRRMIAEASDAGFTAFLGYEWHSSFWGDYCLVFPEDQPELFLPDNPTDLFGFAKRAGAFAIPHHVAYKQGWRGANWSVFDSEVAPVVEIFSEHGCTEHDRAPYPMVLHSNGGRSTSSTVERQLMAGRRFGFVASTDDHFGYPGAYGEGLVGVWAESRAPSVIFDAIRERRTFAVTGDRISLELSVNGRPMGTEQSYTPGREIEAHVSAPDAIDVIELVKNGRVIGRDFPGDRIPAREYTGGSAACRIQYGWGPWSDLDLARTCRWEFEVSVDGGEIADVQPCFQSGPFEEDLRDRVERLSPQRIRVQSFTSRRQAYLLDPTKAVVLHLRGDSHARLSLSVSAPTKILRRLSFGELLADNDVTFTGGFTSESILVHRLVLPEESIATVQWEDEGTGASDDWYYLRVREHNGQMAWSSPLWVEGRQTGL